MKRATNLRNKPGRVRACDVLVGSRERVSIVISFSPLFPWLLRIAGQQQCSPESQ
jgi:hypothetical protein